ncbi:LysR family transcriptional regulator ArgP [Pleomorphomonas carboxyditropha]|uniref:ArgP/LysG family DNA-binding transcriptional regulator n=1 Tax=Pleomorphomonas carboxyditropha TaxID=2023338 RepID=A0A2G9WRR6_9HYPH|nr:LysR family transcriptional regulator ArgP [Pleomorphomonas carboxyditropha]PIO97417.1 ArgP/LysG family DNA-binding transcriptional regulator [Pleomorphomonas carboxyditropha]
MIDYSAALAVAAIVRTGSFDKAARTLGVTPSAISQRVRLLEERLGAVLIERGNPCTATEKGAWLCRHVELVGMLETDLLERLPGLGDPLAGPVTLDIAVNADSLGTWFLPAAAAFTRTSKALLRIAVDDQDHTADWLRRGHVVAAVTSLEKPVAGCKVSPLGRLRYHATASPDFIARHFPDGVTAAALSRAPAITFNQKDGLQQDWAMKTLGATEPGPTHWLPSTQGFVEAALLGMGWGLNPTRLIADHLATGRLVELVPGATLDVTLHWQVSRLVSSRFPELTRAVLDAAKEALL